MFHCFVVPIVVFYSLPFIRESEEFEYVNMCGFTFHKLRELWSKKQNRRGILKRLRRVC